MFAERVNNCKSLVLHIDIFCEYILLVLSNCSTQISDRVRIISMKLWDQMGFQTYNPTIQVHRS